MTVSDAFDEFPTATTLLVTVQSDDEFYEEGREAIERLQRGERIEDPDTFSFPSVDTLFETFNPRTMALLEAISEEHPESIRETARIVDRDNKNVHEELTELERLGVIRFESEGRSKRPVFPYEEVVISLPFTGDDRPDRAAAKS
jgi:predicted transcriptional regulator